MPRRVYELAKELDIETKDLVARLEKLGITGKRSQSSLTEDEIERVTSAIAAEEKPGLMIGQERVVTGVAGERLVECRVGTNVIRRRASTPVVSERPEEVVELIEPIPLEPEALSPFGVPEPLLGRVESPVLPAFAELPEVPLPVVELEPIVEPEPVGEALPEMPEELLEEETLPEEEAPPEPIVLEPVAVAEVTPVAATAVEPPAVAREAVAVAGAVPEVEAERRPGPRVLGRIDLKKAEADRTAALERSASAEAARARRAPMEIPAQPVEPGRGAPAKRKKRRVIQKPEFAEAPGQETRMGRLPRKKRALPGKEQKKTEITTARPMEPNRSRMLPSISTNESWNAFSVSALT